VALCDLSGPVVVATCPVLFWKFSGDALTSVFQLQQGLRGSGATADLPSEDMKINREEARHSRRRTKDQHTLETALRALLRFSRDI